MPEVVLSSSGVRPQVTAAGERPGGGYDDPFTRDPEQVARDARYGPIEAKQALTDCGIVLTMNGELDATAQRRAAR